MVRFPKILTAALLLVFLAVSVALPARAFDAKTGDTVTIGKDEIINDDLYVAAGTVIVDGTIQGDLIAAGSTIVINGTVEGDLIAAGAEITINGAVGDDARIAGAALTLGENASIGDDLVGAGASFESKIGSTIGGDLIMADAQNLLMGDVTGNAELASAAVEIHGKIGGNVIVNLGVSNGNQSQTVPMNVFGGRGQQIQVPQVETGLTLADGAQVGGNLQYTYDHEVAIPAGIVAGTVERIEPQLTPEQQRQMRALNPTPAQRVINSILGIVRNFITILLVGLLLGWLFPTMVDKMGQTIQQKPLPALGWGVAAWVVFFFSLLMVILALVLGALFFGALTLGSLSGLFIWGGLLVLFALTFSFIFVAIFGAQVIASQLGGKLLLERIRPQWAAHRVWPLAFGALIFSLILALPVVGGLIALVALFLGLGALWMMAAQWRQARKSSAIVNAAP
ncbi:MAG: hypothetical protein CO094_04280 [Anaerolineae bacterium CG_4_9_14_3_um_filter_57_17]|nr:hypothetical protein [bacterium]NCT20724.1 hypothetical protein [bacterium]OIO84068.1 MAG: hypothetical protein AUK01_10490 [Anaerolineae bacterium CG2_30_57_67]PJB67414.1 MAG: hypothetical protein CO094_04280 [Anaerolineae bacterium CG_4_9_14_3_um_filter_57_17]